MKTASAVIRLCALGALLLSVSASAGEAGDALLLTRYELIIGVPYELPGVASAPAPAPGAVVFAEDEASSRDLTGLKEKLRETYGLRAVYTTAVAVKELAVGATVAMPTAPSELGVSLTLEGVEADAVTYLVRLEANSQLLASPKIVVKPGGRAIVASRDGAHAPYAFIVIEARPQLPAPKLADGVAEPRVVEKVSPMYPEAARKARTQGAVVLGLTIGADGQVLDVAVLQAQPDGLTEAAVAAVKTWRYEPARTSSGKKVPVELTVTITFRLQ